MSEKQRDGRIHYIKQKAFMQIKKEVKAWSLECKSNLGFMNQVL